ncbi:Dynamin [Dactylellina cionopaga]|nr:Dynamin [Dactylellina cionopaga]
MTTSTLVTLSSETNRSRSFLQKIAELRAQGVGDHISLPQLVVCGDQSAGKSSVLEGITGIPFPRNDGVCTKFATEITLTHTASDHAEIKATIIPHSARSDEEKARLSAKTWTLASLSFTELPTIISEVGEIMGLRGFGRNYTGPAFGEDIFSIQVSANIGCHLTVVDLPGLISVANDEQTSDDVALVEKMVDQYIESSRTIIIAIIQATNDIANQRIIQKAQRFDPDGERTVGVITKPDLINRGTERRIAMLSRNEDTTKLKRGYFIVKNPAPKDLEAGDLTVEKRKQLELDFFAKEPWSEQELDPARVGMSRLTTYLQNILDEHVEKELPNVQDEIRRLLERTEGKLCLLGPERKTVAEMKMYLADVSLKFHDICQQGLEGNYSRYADSFFQGDETRIRAQVHLFNSEFAREMRTKGAKWHYFVDFEDEDGSKDASEDEYGSRAVTRDGQSAGKNWVLKIYRRTRGRELQGAYNSVLLAELFHEQSTPWPAIAQAHLQRVYNSISSFTRKALACLLNDELVLRRVYPDIQESLLRNLEEAKKELNKLLSDEKRFPVTYNHYYSDNIQKARKDDLKKAIQTTIGDSTNDQFTPSWDSSKRYTQQTMDAATLRKCIDSARVTVNMESQACKEAATSLKAYYKVALKTFVDNVCRQVIERHILANLPEIFSPVKVIQFSDEKILHLVSESEEIQRGRHELQSLKSKLESGLSILI